MEPPRKRTRAPSFTLEFPGDNTVKAGLRTRMNNVRELLTAAWNKAANNTDILDYLLDKFCDSLETNGHRICLTTSFL